MPLWNTCNGRPFAALDIMQTEFMSATLQACKKVVVCRVHVETAMLYTFLQASAEMRWNK